jgi:type II secretory ATPase GspE/PulE/Tfp pilus assembly ATPase PilB-like protein
MSTARNGNSRAPAPADNSAPQLLEQLVQQAEMAGASDIHLHRVGATAQICFRLDGLLTTRSSVAGELADRLFGRIKYLARLKTYQESLPQDGRIDRAELKSQNDIRVSTYPSVTGEKIVLRLFQGGGVRPLGELGLPEAGVQVLQEFLRLGTGLLLLSGPAGSGKTTTIHGCLAALASDSGRHIITVEDPVEQIVPGVMQTEVNEARGLTFAQAARHLLRQDPQSLVIGEIRDEETAGVAVRAALTGHLTISTLHAGSCPGVWERFRVLCPDSSSALSALELLWNQRLIRRLCANCRGTGCETCLQSGFHGRVPLAEWCRLDDAIRRRVQEQGAGVLQPAIPMESAGRDLLTRGLTKPVELERVFAR